MKRKFLIWPVPRGWGGRDKTGILDGFTLGVGIHFLGVQTTNIEGVVWLLEQVTGGVVGSCLFS